MKFHQKLQTLTQKKSSEQKAKLSKTITSVLIASAFLYTLPAQALTSYLGINNGTGYNTDPGFVDRSIQQTKDLNLGVARMGIDGVGGNTEGAGFNWSARDMVVNKYLEAGIEIQAPIGPRFHVNRDGNYEQWKANFRYFVRNVMMHYKGKIFYYIIDNEPDLDYGNGTMSAQQCVDMTRIAYETAKSIDPNIKIESPPPTGPGSYLLKEMIDLGIDKVSDYIGIHAYGGQIREGELANPWRLLAARNIKKPVAISESGTISSWYQGSDTERENYRKRWFVIFGQQLKRYGYNHALLFDLDSHGDWAVSPNFNPTPTYQQIKSLRLNKKFSNPGFELANDADNEWVNFDNDDIRLGASPYVSFVRGDTGGAHGGNGYVKLDSGRASGGKRIFVRRVVGDLPKGKNVKIGAWVYVNGGATATLKALGYDNLDGDAEISKTSTKKNAWEYLEITVPISQYWAVVELGTSGTGNSSDYVKWDDVMLNDGTSGGGTSGGGTSGGGTSGGGTSGGGTQPTNKVTFYEHGSFAGKSQSFGVGTYGADKGQLDAVGNDNISSMRVPQGLNVRVCEHAGGGGLCKDFASGDYDYVGNNLNDKITYIEVKKQ
jgi:uncharacterized membrane protein YgcG